MIPAEKGVVKEQIKLLDKELQRISQTIAKTEDLKESIKRAISLLERIENSITEDEEIKNLIKEIKLLKNYNEQLYRIDEYIKELSNDLDILKKYRDFLEHYRNYRYYYLEENSLEKAVSFLRSYSPSYYFLPSIVGEVSIQKISRDLSLPKEQAYLIVDYENLPKFLHYLYKYNIFPSKLFNSKATIFMKNPRVFLLLSDKEEIKKADEIALKENIEILDL